MDVPFPRSPENKRPLGRLLEEISWDGGPCTKLRDALQGKENSLTTETFAALDLLPRTIFFAGVLEASSGGSDEVRHSLISDCEALNLTVLPGSTFLKPSARAYSRAVPVQPDVLIESSRHYCFVEAKAIARRSSFQKKQLARQFVAAARDCGGRVPVLLLVLPAQPPISIAGSGRKAIHDAIGDDLSNVIAESEGVAELGSLPASVEANVLWITWDQIQRVVLEKLELMTQHDLPETILGSIYRLGNALVEAIEWHSKPAA